MAGFSLIELVIVIAIVLTIAAIAIPNFLRSKMRANETSAAASLRMIATAEVAYQTTYQQGFSPTLAALGPPLGGPPSAAAADLVDQVVANGIKSGYTFVYAAITVGGSPNPNQFTINANPIALGQTGEICMFVDQTNVLRGTTACPATAASPPLPR